MITQIETLSYRSLRYIRQPLGPFQVLIGPNASGKSTFLDVVAFLADVVREVGVVSSRRLMMKDGVIGAVEARAPDIRDLIWMRRGDSFELAVEALVPAALHRQKNGQAARLRYEVRVGTQAPSHEVNLLGETLWLRPELEEDETTARTFFPLPPMPPARRRALTRSAHAAGLAARRQTGARLRQRLLPVGDVGLEQHFPARTAPVGAGQPAGR